LSILPRLITAYIFPHDAPGASIFTDINNNCEFSTYVL
jgi:hypothetical protein